VAQYAVVRWQEIPAVVEAHDGPDAVTLSLSERFQALIDSVAVQFGLEGSEAYLEQWNRSEPGERAGNARAVAEAVAAELEQRFPEFAAQAFRRPS
jgi:Virulence factor